MDVTIRNFGNDTVCNTIGELKETLANKYAGMSVSLQYLDNSSYAIDYIDVSDFGAVTYSYGDKGPFDFTHLDRP